MQANIPIATYRQQLNRTYGLNQAADLVDYLYDLGVSHCYTSPLLEARSGSNHGYDVVDHARLNPEIGTEEELAHLASRLSKKGMSIVIDVVPNHMCINSGANRWWFDVMEDGPGSPFANFFDIDWKPPKADLNNKVLLPFLGDQYGRVLEKQEIQVAYTEGSFVVRYWELKLPIAPRTWEAILQPAVESLRENRDPEDLVLLELESILSATAHLPARTETAPAMVRERQREKFLIKRRLKALAEANEDVRNAIADSLTLLNGSRGIARSFDRLEGLLAEQAYRLSYWRVAADEINYRRFFTVNDLGAIRVEEPKVFDAVHERLFHWISRGWITGVRVDHPDGLFDPAQYLRDLQQGCLDAITRAISEGQSGGEVPPPAVVLSGPGEAGRPVYVVVEKILGRNEQLQPDWPVHGTTGYEFLNLVNGVFVATGAEKDFREIYERFTGNRQDAPDLIYRCKKFILDTALSSELHVLVRELDRISEQHRWSRDFTLNSLNHALAEIIACFPVYRSYTRGEGPVGTDDRRHIAAATRAAKRRNPATSPSLFDFIASVLLLEVQEGEEDSRRDARRRFALKLQQLTGPVMAKAVEDTAFYRYFPLACLNEVGGELEWFGVPVERFHSRNASRFELWPHSLSATSTHDTKRSEDVRSRIDVLSELPDEWDKAIHRWHGLNRESGSRVEGQDVPVPNDEYLFYQTLVGTWPTEWPDETAHATYVARVQAYMIKALKEASQHTSWINPNDDYEKAINEFVSASLRQGEENRFLADFVTFQKLITRCGMLNSLAQVVLKVASPGVPDFYQGTEVWDFSLVDPDNRRTVDYERLKEMLDRLGARGSTLSRSRLDELIADPEDGCIKLYITSRALAFRSGRVDLFQKGDYLPLEVTGKRADNVVAFCRESREGMAIVLTGRHFARLGDPASLCVDSDLWSGTSALLPVEAAERTYRDMFSGCEIQAIEDGDQLLLPLDKVFSWLPLAILEPSP